jgi:O-antigen ligase
MPNLLKLSSPQFGLNIARLMICCMLPALFISPPLTNLLQFLVLIICLLTTQIRQMVMQQIKHPIVIATLAFFIMLTLSALYAQDWALSISMLGGWRKILLLPIVFILFHQTNNWRITALHTFITTAFLFSLLSFVFWSLNIIVPWWSVTSEIGVVVRNHATQGMFFAIAGMISIALTQYLVHPSQQWIRLPYIIIAFLTLSNAIFITTGRSGYAVVIVSACILCLSWVIHNRDQIKYPLWKKILLGFVATGLFSSTLYVSPTAQQKIQQAIHEIKTYQKQDTENLTSMGIRVFFVKNTLSMIQSHPWMGTGTGNFSVGYQHQIKHQIGAAATNTSDPHNQFLKIIAEHGLIGSLFFILFIAAIIKQSLPYCYRTILLMLLLSWSTTSLFNSHFSTYAEGTLLYILLGICLSATQKTTFFTKV